MGARHILADALAILADGSLVLLAVEQRDDAFMADIEQFYHDMGLPKSLKDLRLSAVTQPLIEAIAAHTATAPAGAYLIVSASAAQIVAGIEAVERRSSKIAPHIC
jgi:glycerol dehydrogenase-like iron-containing ADH family enzyme